MDETNARDQKTSNKEKNIETLLFYERFKKAFLFMGIETGGKRNPKLNKRMNTNLLE